MPEWLKILLRPVYFRVLHWRGNPGINMHSLVIEKIIHEYDDVFSFVLDGALKPGFRAGQYGHVVAPGAIRDNHHVRHMSFANAPHEKRIIISMDVGSKSRFKRKFAKAAVGDGVKIFAVKGDFVFETEDHPQSVLLIAGGIGIVPIRALISDFEYSGKHDWSLVYTGRDYLYRDFWTQFGDRVSLTGRKRLFEDLRAALMRAPQGCAVYLCGSDDFIANVRVFLERNGVSPTQIHVENFDHQGPS